MSQNPLQVWCPVVGRHLDSSIVTVMPIIPPTLNYRYLAYLLGYEANDYNGGKVMKSCGNGMVMLAAFQARFRNGDFVIVPIETPEGQPQRLRFKLLNWWCAGFRVGNSSVRFFDLDGRELIFQDSGGRPDLACLYWHYVVSTLKARKRRAAEHRMGFEDAWVLRTRKQGNDENISGPEDEWISTLPPWRTPGKYMRKSVIKGLVWLLHLEEAVFEEGVWKGKGAKGALFDSLVARDLADAVAKDWADDDSDDRRDEGVIKRIVKSKEMEVDAENHVL